MKFVFSKSIMLNDKDWSASSIHEIIEDILETKKATLGSKGFYSHVSGEISPFLTRLVPVPEFLLSTHRVVRKSPSKINILFARSDGSKAFKSNSDIIHLGSNDPEIQISRNSLARVPE